MSLRNTVFLLGCICSRSVLSYLSSNMNLLPYIGALYLLFSIGIFYIYIFGSKKADSQLEWLGDKKIWSNSLLSPVHRISNKLFGSNIFLTCLFSKLSKCIIFLLLGVWKSFLVFKKIWIINNKCFNFFILVLFE